MNASARTPPRMLPQSASTPTELSAPSMRMATPRKLGDRQTQRALMQLFESRNGFVVHNAFVEAGRHDLIGGAKHCLIPAQPQPCARRKAPGSHRTRARIQAKDAGTLTSQQIVTTERSTRDPEPDFMLVATIVVTAKALSGGRARGIHDTWCEDVDAAGAISACRSLPLAQPGR